MDFNENKIDIFRNCVLLDAKNQCDRILKKAEDEKCAKIQKAEDEILNNIYKQIQLRRAALLKETGEKISSASYENRLKLIKTRNKIADKVFNEFKEKVDAFRTGEKYKDFIFNLVKDGLSAVGDGKCTVFIDKKDKALSAGIEAEFGVNVEFDDIFGGCKVINCDKGIICSNTFNEKFDELRHSFFEKAELSI